MFLLSCFKDSSRDESEDTTSSIQVTINTPLNEITEDNLRAYPVSGTCSAEDGTVTVTVGTAFPIKQPDCNKEGTWKTTVNIESLPSGSVAIIAYQTDAFDNLKEDEKAITKTIGHRP